MIKHNELVNIFDISECVGDGIIDDTDELQKVLSYCSNRGLTAYLPAQTSLLVTKALYIWGGASLIGEDHTSRIYIKTASPYVFNFGLRERRVHASIWSGCVARISFHAMEGSGRILFFWRSDGASVKDNQFYLNATNLGAMSSGNNSGWLVDGPNGYVRKNLTVTGNRIIGKGDMTGSEGIGLNQWDTATVAYNEVDGVADDAIGIHFCKNITIYSNQLTSTDGRLYLSQSIDCTITGNKISRVPSRSSGQFSPGIALIYIGHENNVANAFPTPTNITVSDNELIYPQGSIDQGAAITVYGPRNVVISRNTVRNDSSTGTQVGVHLLPYVYGDGLWTDPTGVEADGVARVRAIEFDGNNLAAGRYSTQFKMTGQTVAYYVGPVSVRNMVALSYAFLGNPTASNNITRS